MASIVEVLDLSFCPKCGTSTFLMANTEGHVAYTGHWENGRYLIEDDEHEVDYVSEKFTVICDSYRCDYRSDPMYINTEWA